MIIIIGLPGSEKTCMSQQFSNYEIYDDFISEFYNGKMIKSLKTNKNICILLKYTNYITINKYNN